MYVADETNSGAYLSDVECFIQTLAVYPESATFFTSPLDIYYFSGNTAIKQGPNLFGEVLDRYITSSLILMKFIETQDQEHKLAMTGSLILKLSATSQLIPYPLYPFEFAFVTVRVNQIAAITHRL